MSKQVRFLSQDTLNLIGELLEKSDDKRAKDAIHETENQLLHIGDDEITVLVPFVYEKDSEGFTTGNEIQNEQDAVSEAAAEIEGGLSISYAFADGKYYSV